MASGFWLYLMIAASFTCIPMVGGAPEKWRYSVRDTDADWQSIAEKNPYWGVISADRFEGKTLTHSIEKDFFGSGSVYVSHLLNTLNKTFGFTNPSRVLDFGSGVGRLTLAFARRADTVVGLDISAEMLRLSRKHAAEQGVHNTTFAQSDDELSGGPGEFDLINSLIVLQHIPPERGLKIIERLLRKVRIGGAFSLQVTYAKAHRFLVNEQGRARYYRREGDRAIDLLPTPHELPTGTITMFDYDLNAVIALISQYAGHPVLMLPTRDDDHLGLQFIGLRGQ